MTKQEEITLATNITLGEICGIRATNRQTLIACINSFIGGKQCEVYLRVELSGEQLGCEGCSADYATEDDVPYRSVPCSCGNPSHWLIKYEE